MALGTCIGKFTHSGKFHLTIGALDILAQYAKYKVGGVQGREEVHAPRSSTRRQMMPTSTFSLQPDYYAGDTWGGNTSFKFCPDGPADETIVACSLARCHALVLSTGGRALSPPARRDMHPGRQPPRHPAPLSPPPFAVRSG